MSNNLTARAIHREIRVSPSKLGLVAGLIRGLPVHEALLQLQFSSKRIAHTVKKCLESAIANAENNHNMDVAKLVICLVTVGKGKVMKRMRPRARGRGNRILKPHAHLEIKLQEADN